MLFYNVKAGFEVSYLYEYVHMMLNLDLNNRKLQFTIES